MRPDEQILGWKQDRIESPTFPPDPVHDPGPSIKLRAVDRPMITLLQGDKLEHSSTPASLNRANPERSLELALAAARVAAETRGTNIVVLDMTNSAAWVDYFVVATGTSRRQLHAMSEEIDHKLEDDLGDKRMNIDGYDESRWIVLDYGTVVVHLFDEDTRSFYSLENLWADAERLDLSETLKGI